MNKRAKAAIRTARTDEDHSLHTLQHPTTKRWAVFDDDGTSAWLLVTEPEIPKPVADCFVYSCVPVARKMPKTWDGSGPPPMIKKYASDAAYRPGLSADRIRLAWTKSGSAALVLVDDTPVAFLVVGEKQGYSRGIAVDGPYGHPWDEARFKEVFRE
jgi:hypothetical protein